MRETWNKVTDVATWVWVGSAILPIAGTALTLVLVSRSDTSLTWLVIAGLFMAIAGLISVPAWSGSEFTPAYIVAAALPFIATPELGSIFDRPGRYAVIAGGLSALWVVRTARGDDQRRVFVTFIRRAVAFSVYLAVAGYAEEMTMLDRISDWRAFGVFILAASAGFLVEVGLGAIVRVGPRGGKRRYLAYLTFRDIDVFMALTATGALFGLAFEAIGWWAIGVAALPYLFTHGAFRRLEAAKKTYAQTVRALAQIPEVGGHTHAGHAARTADLAVEIATEMGLRPSEVEEIELAGLMHDIGRVTLNEPNILRMGYTEADLARWGSEIVGEAAYLSEVATIVNRQHEPYRSPGEDRDPDVPLASRIVKVASAYDESTAEMGFSALEAMERLHRGSVYDYDPAVVAALRHSLERRGVFGHPASV